MKIIILKNKEEISIKIALILYNEIRKNPSIILGLATGNTIKFIYQELSEINWKKPANFSQITTFNLDEYVINKKKYLLREFMKHYFFKPLKIKKEQVHFLTNGRNPKKTCRNYEKSIYEIGGIDLQLLGIGRNGHIAFNEPGSNINSRCRVVDLHNITREDAIKTFQSLEKVPKKAMTLGVRNILEARKIIMVAFGKNKAKAVNEMVNGKLSNKIPASFLRKHKNVIVFLDEDAGSLLKVN